MRKPIRWIFVAMLSLIAVFSFSVAGCTQPTPAEESTTEASATEAATTAEETKAEAEKFVIAMVPPALVSPYFIECADSATKAAANYENIEFSVLSPSDETKVDEQVKILEDLLQKQVDLILISSGNWDAVAPTLKKAIDSGIEVAIFNQLSDVPVLEDLGLVSAVGVDEVEGGTVAGKWVGEALNGKGKIAILEGVA